MSVGPKSVAGTVGTFSSVPKTIIQPYGIESDAVGVALVAALRAVLMEVTDYPAQRPVSSDSYLPSAIIDQMRPALDAAGSGAFIRQAGSNVITQ